MRRTHEPLLFVSKRAMRVAQVHSVESKQYVYVCVNERVVWLAHVVWRESS